MGCTGGVQKLRISDNGRIVDPCGRIAVFWLGVTTWNLFHKLSVDNFKGSNDMGAKGHRCRFTLFSPKYAASP